VRRPLAILLAIVLAAAASACGSASSGSSAPAGSGGSSAAAACPPGALQTLQNGTLTIGTDNPAYSPYFTGGAGHEWSGQFNNDPYTGKGFEDAVAYAVAKQLGYPADKVKWSVTPFNNSFKPGPKNFDFYLAQVSYSDKRAENADLSDSYYDVNQAVVALAGKPIDSATSIADLKPYKLGAQIGTTNYDYITQQIKPDSEPQVYTTENDALAALKNGQIDGLVVDFPTAWYMANVQLPNGHLVGQFPVTGNDPEHFSLVLSKDSPLTACVNSALATLHSDGTLQEIQTKWLSDVAKAPVLQ
jgi:polar amino acid transport system substrate-binding protein